jgi:hypothetical protein
LDFARTFKPWEAIKSHPQPFLCFLNLDDRKLTFHEFTKIMLR